MLTPSLVKDTLFLLRVSVCRFGSDGISTSSPTLLLSSINSSNFSKEYVPFRVLSNYCWTVLLEKTLTLTCNSINYVKWISEEGLSHMKVTRTLGFKILPLHCMNSWYMYFGAQQFCCVFCLSCKIYVPYMYACLKMLWL